MLIQQKISRPAFERWFKGTSAIKLDDQHIRVICLNNFSMDWLEENYKNDIIVSLQEVTGETFSLDFCVVERY